MPAPASLPTWNTSGLNRTEPSAGIKASGWLVNDPINSSYFNWWMWLVYQWVLYLQGLYAKILGSNNTWTGLNTFNNQVTVNGNVDVRATSAIAGFFLGSQAGNSPGLAGVGSGYNFTTAFALIASYTGSVQARFAGTFGLGFGGGPGVIGFGGEAGGPGGRFIAKAGAGGIGLVAVGDTYGANIQAVNGPSLFLTGKAGASNLPAIDLAGTIDMRGSTALPHTNPNFTGDTFTKLDFPKAQGTLRISAAGVVTLDSDSRNVSALTAPTTSIAGITFQVGMIGAYRAHAIVRWPGGGTHRKLFPHVLNLKGGGFEIRCGTALASATWVEDGSSTWADMMSGASSEAIVDFYVYGAQS